MIDPRSASDLDIEPVVRAALDMMATGQPEGLAMVTADVEMRGPMGEVRGRDLLRTHLSDWRDGLTDVDIVVERMAVDRGAVIVDWHLAGRHTGAVFLMEDLLFEPTGRRVDLDITTQLVFRGRRICAFQHEYVLDDLLRQLRAE